MRNWNSQPEWSDKENRNAPRRLRIREGNHGNGRPDRPSKLNRTEQRLEQRVGLEPGNADA